MHHRLAPPFRHTTLSRPPPDQPTDALARPGGNQKHRQPIDTNVQLRNTVNVNGLSGRRGGTGRLAWIDGYEGDAAVIARS